MIIITAPHPSLRAETKPIQTIDKKVSKFVQNFGETLIDNAKKGIGLAAPQVDKPWRLFATYIPPATHSRPPKDDSIYRELKIYLNPRIVKHSPKPVLKDDAGETPLEGCLSIPGFFGPVPRFWWIEVEYDELIGDQLVGRSERFEAFPARLVQHEIDHLHGILFTDYILEYDLPIYKNNPKTDKLEPFEERELLEVF